MNVQRASLALAVVLITASWIFVFAEQGSRLSELFSTESLQFAGEFLSGLAGRGEATPAYLDPESWRRALGLAYETLAMSVLAAGIAGIGMLLTVIPAARNAASGDLTLSGSKSGYKYGRALFFVVRALYIFARAVPELVWAMLIVFVFAPGILPGALALGLHNFGIVGKLCAEVVEDLDARPVRSLRASGAGTVEMLFYGVLPTVLPQFLTYLLYRWEVIVRTTIVVGFVSAGGLGREFRLAMSWFHYSDVALLLLVYIGLVFLVDALSGGLRGLSKR